MRTQFKLTLMSILLIAVASSVEAIPRKDGKPDGGTLNYGEYGRPATLDPVTSNDMIAMRITELLFNGLVGINQKQQIVPELAEKWNISNDNRVYTFTLRKDVKWHPREGVSKPFTAKDVVFTHAIMMHPKTITPLKVRYEFIQSVKQLDDYTVEFTLKRPILNALAKFTFKIIPEHGPANGQYLKRDDPFVRQPIGTGPYILKEVTGNGDIVMVANEEYFKGRPHLDQFVAKPFADQNIMNQALMFNSINMTVLVNPRNIPELQGDKRYVLQPYNALSYAFFGYNTRHPLLSDKRVRKAFTMAINRHEMLRSFFNNRGTVISGPFAPGSWAYNLDVKPMEYSSQEAVRLLTEAGFSKGSDGVMQKDGKKLNLTLRVPIAKESEATKRVVLSFQNYLKQIGADIKVEFMEWQAWKEAVFLKHEFDIMFASWVFDDSADISSLFHSGEIGPWKNNFGGYSNPEVDGLITEAKLSLDHEKKRTIYRKLHAVLSEENPYSFLWTLTNYAGYNKNIRHVKIHPYKFFSFADDWYMPKGKQ
ncbi:MAG: ABC transporter substrate-binding protein [Gammaproteobacteria bacterium]|nr:ABC transporter substrate-binding protein [Gammaproteobacteria bacterium]MDH5800368.1 ABC transporter substrate-binding protein [Gammaproteobacteria bacterium]